jgi:hypothetical protein
MLPETKELSVEEVVQVFEEQAKGSSNTPSRTATA